MRDKIFKVVFSILFGFMLMRCGKEAGAQEETVSQSVMPETASWEVSASELPAGQQKQTGFMVNAVSEESGLKVLEEEYQAHFDAIENVADITINGYDIMEGQIFSIAAESFDAGECTFIPAMEENYHRLAIFLADAEGKILFKTNELETNNRIPGQLWQPTRDLGAVTFTDLNQDGRTDIVLITRCVNDTGEYAGKPYKIGDVLFQGEGIFYRDWRISDKINRFDMNRSVNSIISFVRDGNSTEFLYTATTLDELLKNGFTIIEEQHYTRRFEKLGRIQVVPGTFRMSEYDIFMIYLVDEQGDIVWSFQPMGSYDNLYSLRGVVGKDVDGDGMKDLIVLARYTYEGPSGELLIQSACSIYYQRTSGFDIDTGFTENYLCTEEDTMEALIPKIRAYWGWKVEEAEDD